MHVMLNDTQTLQCVAVCCSVLQRGSIHMYVMLNDTQTLQCVAVCCSEGAYICMSNQMTRRHPRLNAYCFFEMPVLMYMHIKSMRAYRYIYMHQCLYTYTYIHVLFNGTHISAIFNVYCFFELPGLMYLHIRKINVCMSVYIHELKKTICMYIYMSHLMVLIYRLC